MLEIEHSLWEYYCPNNNYHIPLLSTKTSSLTFRNIPSIRFTTLRYRQIPWLLHGLGKNTYHHKPLTSTETSKPSVKSRVAFLFPLRRYEFPDISKDLGQALIIHHFLRRSPQTLPSGHPEYTSSFTFRNFPSKCFITCI